MAPLRAARGDRTDRIQRVVEPKLDTTEREQFARSASALRAVAEQFGI